jgi:hypothetical protein
MYVYPLIVPQNRDRCYENAAKNFAKVVELELKARVFERFRQDVLPKVAGNTFLAVGSQDPNWLKNFKRFLQGPPLLSRTPLKGGVLNLDKMSQILHKSASCVEPMGQKFCRWIRQTNPGLLNKDRLLSDICELRGAATHERMAAESCEKVARGCRELLDVLVTDRPA